MLPPKTLPKKILGGLYVHQSHQIFRTFFPEFAIFSQIWLIPLVDDCQYDKIEIKKTHHWAYFGKCCGFFFWWEIFAILQCIDI